MAIGTVPEPFTDGAGWLLPAGATVMLFAVGAYALRHPDCGMQDCIAGTRMVPH